MRTMLSVAVLLAASIVSALPALAQSDEEYFPPGMMMGQGCGPSGMMGGRHMMGGRMWRMDAEAPERLANLKAKLEITDAQAKAWQGYADVVAAQASAMQAAHKAVGDVIEKGGTLERLDARISGMEAMLQSLKSLKPAVEKLYSAFNADQKKLADELIGGGCGAM